MSKKVPVSNNTKMPIYVGSLMVPAGETRLFDEDQVPPHLKPAEEEVQQEEVNPVLAFLDNSVTDIIGQFPTLTDGNLAELKEAEVNGKNRKSLIEAIDALVLERASNKEDAQNFLANDEETIFDSLEDVEELEGLHLLLALESEGQKRENVMSAIQDEVNDRAPGD